jgi:GT2 family glycosyltransferase
MSHRIKVVDIELSHPLTTIKNLDGYGELEALIRLHGRPIGKVRVPVISNCCPATTLSRVIVEQHSSLILRHLLLDGLVVPQLHESAVTTLSTESTESHQVHNGRLPVVTIAVCTRDRTPDLALCLDALSHLDYPALDILVVDNAPSSDATEELVRTNYQNVRYAREPRPGLSWARNRAIVEARGEIIAYTDDDVVVDPGWVKALVNVFAESSEVMAVTGYVVAYELETEAQIIFEQAYRFGRGFESKLVRADQKSVTQYGTTANLGTGANMAYRRSLFDQIGYFDPALGAGTITTGGEDLEMFFRVLQEGYTLVYEPNALVRHRHRRDYAQLQKQITNNCIGYCSYLVRSALAYPDTYSGFIQIGLWFLWSTLNRLLRSFVRPSRYPRDLILAELWGFYVGFGRYQRAYQVAVQIEETFGSLAPDCTITEAQAATV